MVKIISKVNSIALRAKLFMTRKKEGNDQLVTMFVIIAVAAGIMALLYIFLKTNLLPDIQKKLTTMIDNWFDHS